jgi:hypothetical protein
VSIVALPDDAHGLHDPAEPSREDPGKDQGADRGPICHA